MIRISLWKSRKLIPILAAAAVVFSITTLQTSQIQAQDKKLVLGVAYQSLSRPINVSAQDGTRKAAKELGIELRETDAQDKFDKQLNDIQDLLAQNIDGLLVWPADSGGALEFIQMAKKVNVPIISVTTPIGVPDPKDPYRPAKGLSGFVTWDDVGAGKRAAEAMMGHFGKRDKPITIAVLEGRSGYLSVDLRRRAFDKTLESGKYPHKVVSAQPGDWTQEKGEAVCQNFIAANPELNAIYSMSDEMSVGCARAIKGAGSKAALFSVGGSAKGIQLIKNGEMVATVCYKPADNGYLAVHAMRDILKGGSPKTDAATVSDSPAITKANLADCVPQW